MFRRNVSARLKFFTLGAVLFSCASTLCAAQTLITTVQVGAYPTALAVNAATNKIYVVNQHGNSVTVIDGVTNQTASVATGLRPQALAVNQATNKIYVANLNAATVTVIDGTNNHTATVNTGIAPTAVAVNSVTNRIYVANYQSNSVTVIDGATNRSSTIGVGQRPYALAVNSVTNTIYIADCLGNDVTIIDGASGATAAVAVGAYPIAVAVNSVTNQIYVANYQSNSVSVIDGATDSVVPVSVGVYPFAIGVDAVHNQIYVANSGDGSATVISGATLATTMVPIGSMPEGLDVDPTTNKAYFSNVVQQGTVTMLDGANDSTSSVFVGEYPVAVAVNPVTHRIYAANSVDNTVSVIAGATSDPLQFMLLTPCRLVDTRQANGPFGGPAIAAGTSRNFSLPQSNCGIPSNAAAYSLNVTVVPRGALGYLTIWPTGESQPLVSTLNSLDGRVKANAAIVPAGSDGAVSIYASSTTDVILDIDGYFQPATGQSLQFYPVTPCRALDTRNQHGYLGGPYLQGTRERDFPVQASDCQIPSTAQAYSMNFTVVPWQNQPLGYLSVWAAGGSQPMVSTLNNPTATTVANAAIVPAGLNGAIAVYPDQNTQLIADINGYFAPPGQGGLSLYPTPPCRVLDTRLSGGAFSGQRNPPVDVVDSPCLIPNSAEAYVLNVTAVPVGILGYLTLWPDGVAMPLASTLNALDGIITSNMSVVQNLDGRVDAYAAGTTQLIVDISSYFAP